MLSLEPVPCDAGCAPVRPPYDAEVASPRNYDDDDDEEDMMDGGGRGQSTHALLREGFDYAAFR